MNARELTHGAPTVRQQIFTNPDVSNCAQAYAPINASGNAAKQYEGEHMRQGLAATCACVSILAVGCSGSNHSTSPASPTSAVSTTAAATTAAPMPATAMDTLLLTPAEANQATGRTDLTQPDQPSSTMGDLSAIAIDDNKCQFLDAPGQSNIYANTGWSDIRFTYYKNNEDPSSPNFYHSDTVIFRFPSAQQAAAFFNSSATVWSNCSNRQLKGKLTEPPGMSFTFTVGPLSNENNTLSLSYTRVNETGFSSLFTRALAMKNNVVVDVSSTRNGPGGPPPVAVPVAQRIAAKVPD
jgi:PknH-like extracellular domain